MVLEGFKTGAEVEVSSDEDGFRGAWFSARVIRFKPKLRRYTVEYDALVDEGNKSRPLREDIDASHVRPRPPPSAVSFRLNEPVDAFHNDGWWAGVVSKLLREKCAVLFPTTGEEMEFGNSDLRPHLDWVDGCWVDPESKKMVGIEFQTGTLVEASSDEEGFQGAWFTATVIEATGKEKFLIEYQDLRADDGTGLLREFVDSSHIRPAPPNTPVVKEFKLLEEVDALYNDGWWVGVISKVLKGPRYMVYFKPSKEEIEFRHKDLRLHYDWINGRWLRPSQALDL